MKKYEIVEIDYEKLRTDLKSNCEEMINKHNIKFNYDDEKNEYIALIKFDHKRARSLDLHSRGNRSNSRVIRKKKKKIESGKYGIYNDYPFIAKKENLADNQNEVEEKKLTKSNNRYQFKGKYKPLTEKSQKDLHDSCLKNELKSRRKIKRVRSQVVYRPSHSDTRKGLARKLNRVVEGEKSYLDADIVTSGKGYSQVGKVALLVCSSCLMIKIGISILNHLITYKINSMTV